MPNRYYEIKRRESAISSLKEILVIITGLTVTNSVIVLIAGGSYASIKPIHQIPVPELILFGLLLLNIIRFYHGNVRLLDDSYLLKEKTYLHTGHDHSDDRLNHIHWDFIVILITGVLFAFMSFYLENYVDFFTIFTIILVIDVAWYFFTNKDTRDQKIQKQRKYWALNNVAHLLLFLPIVTIEMYSLTANTSAASTLPVGNNLLVFIVLSVLALTNAVADFFVSWEFYFPAKNKIENGEV